MNKSYYSLGLMSGTSMDGVDASIIQSDGKTKYKVILDKYFEYPKDIFKDLTTLRDKIKSSKDLKRFEKQTKSIEKEITLFHAKAVSKIIKKSKLNVDFIGFHGQTIFHNAEEQISRQLGDGKLLSKLTKKKVVCNFRQNDLKNGGQGAPLTPIFHSILVKQKKIPLPVVILNIGGIANVTCIGANDFMYSTDIGPGNCLIDQWIRLNSKKKYDDRITDDTHEVKCVVTNEKELKFYVGYFIHFKGVKTFQPVDSDITNISKMILKHNLTDWNIMLQQHKVLELR